jgi:NAD(P)-dependent dehydrogenase (short-subunit alcohol dehydrogenase family)
LGISVRPAGKVVLVTGAVSGMGRVAVRMFAEQGASVVSLDRLEAPLGETVAEVGPDGGEWILPVAADMTDGETVRRAVAAGVDRFGTLNVPYNNTGIMPDEDTSAEETSAETWRRVFDVNVRGVALCRQHGIPALRAARGGSVVNTASFVSLVGCAVPQDADTTTKAPSSR